MESIPHYMSNDHRHCDDLYVSAEKVVADSDWEAASRHFNSFHHAMEHHFAMEEEVLFPSFEEASGSVAGPTQVMRFEHGQMRELIDNMARAVSDREQDAFLGEAETLLILMQQHNVKEEQMLYPMAERLFGPQGPEVLARIQAVGNGN